MQIYQLKINSFILSLNSVLTILPEYYLATSILSMAIFFSISQKLQVNVKKTKISFFLFSMPQLHYLSILIIFFYCFLCFKQNFFYTFVSFNNAIHIDSISIFAKLIIGLSSLVYLLFIQQYLTDQNINNFEYYIIILTSILGLCLLCCSDDLLTAYLAIELQGLSFYILASFKKTSNYSVESGVKYFILGSFSTVIFLLGTNLIYCESGSISLLDFKNFFSWIFSTDNPFVQTVKDSHTFIETLILLHFKSVILEDIINSNISFESVKYAVLQEIVDIFPDQASNIIYNELSLINMYYVFLDIWLETEVVEKKAILLNEFLKDLDVQKEFQLKNFFSNLLKEKGFILEEFDLDKKDKIIFKQDCFFNQTISQKDADFADYALAIIIDYHKKYGLTEDFFSFELNNSSLLHLGLFFIFISLCFKLALSPFHLWSPDIYEGSPSSTTFFFTVISKLSIFVFLIKISYISFYSFIVDWQIYLLIIALLSILVGSIAGLKQRKFKSLLAYSSISNMGLILVSLSSGNFEGIKAIFYYFIIYILSGLAMWAIFLILRLKRKNSLEKHNKDLGDFSLLKESNVIIAYASVITLFTIAGIPPTAGFLAKIYIFLSLTTSSLYFIALISIVSTVISTFYYIRILKIMFFENLLVGKLFYPINSRNIIICNIVFLSLLFLFINPGLISFASYKTTLFLTKTFY